MDTEGGCQILFNTWPYEILMCLAKHRQDSFSGVMLRFCSSWTYFYID